MRETGGLAVVARYFRKVAELWKTVFKIYRRKMKSGEGRGGEKLKNRFSERLLKETL